MKFISFIASTMLIVLISQHSIMGLPINDTVVEERCSEGFEKIYGQCMPINLTTSSNAIESSSFHSENMIVHEEKPVTELYTPKILGACSEGMKHGKHGICEPIKISETTEANIESATDLTDNAHGEVNLMSCPEGTKRDEEGACQEIKPSNSTKMITDLKVLLKEDGSCPDNYKMVEGRCLYIKSKTNSTLHSSSLTSGDNFSRDVRPKSGHDESAQFELIPVLPDNSCPEGTEYSEFGLCQKDIHSSSSNLAMKANGHCSDDSELINGKCLYKNLHSQSEFTTTNSISESTTLVGQPLNNGELPKSMSETTTIVGRPLNNGELPKSMSETKSTTETTTFVGRPLNNGELPKSMSETKPTTETTTIVGRPLNNGELLKSMSETKPTTETTIVKKPVMESHSEVTSVPL